MAEPCTDCPDEFAADDEAVTVSPGGPDPRGTTVTRWGPALLAPIGKPTGDKRRFAAGALTNRDLPLGLKWQRQDGQGHTGSVVIGTLDGVTYKDGGEPWGFGLLFKPDPEQLPRLAEDVNEARMLLDKGVIGPSVDLDDMEFHQIDPADAGQYAAEQRPDIEVTKGRISAATLVPIPAFAEARALPLTEMDPQEYAAELEAHNAALAPAVRASGWSDLPVADLETEWDGLAAVQRVGTWALDQGVGDLFDDSAADRAYLRQRQFPIADVIDGELTLVPRALEVARVVLDDESLALPQEDVSRMRTVVASIVDGWVPPGDEELAGELAGLAGEDFAALGELAEELAGDTEGSETFASRFDALKARLEGKVSDPGAVAASIGRKKYGKKGMQKLRAGAAASKVKPLRSSSDDEHDHRYAIQDAMVAAAALNEATHPLPPASAFQDPKLPGPTPLTVTADGRVYGHLAAWGTCHTAFPGTCVVPPKSKRQYAYFHTGALDTDGGELAVGRVSIGGGHADTRHGFQAAAEHYDSTSTAAAFVRAGEDKYGIWLAGVLAPGVQPADLKPYPPSGDWRRIGGQLELVHALAVNSGGFPQPRASMVAGAQMALVAAGMLAPALEDVPAGTVTMDVAALVSSVVAETRRSDARYARAVDVLAKLDDDGEASGTASRRLRAAHLARRLFT